MGTITEIADRHELGDREDGFILDIQDQLDAPYYYESELKLVDEFYTSIINRQQKYIAMLQREVDIKNEMLERADRQLDYADEQLNKQLDKIKALEKLLEYQTKAILELINKEEI